MPRLGSVTLADHQRHPRQILLYAMIYYYSILCSIVVYHIT